MIKDLAEGERNVLIKSRVLLESMQRKENSLLTIGVAVFGEAY